MSVSERESAVSPSPSPLPPRPAPAPAAAGTLGLVAAHARATPHALAVLDTETALTYHALMEEAGRLAAALRARGVRPGDAVGLLLPNSPRTVIAQLAVWWAGGHYVPLDPVYPRPRLHAMLADTDAVLTVGEPALLEAAGIPEDRALALPEAKPDSEETDGPDAPAEPLEPFDRFGPFAPYDPGAVAYVMFTSGSTGRPKGVAVTQRGVAELVAEPDYVTLTARDRVLFHSPVTFDAATFEVWGPLAAGAAVAVSTADRLSLDGLARDTERLGATVTVLTAALFHHLVARRSPLFGVLRSVLVGGEALSARHARAVLRRHPWLELVNGYGPTEATTFATAHRVTDADCDGPPPIGRPCAGATALVLDADGEPVPAGARGELWIGGPRLAQGYLGQPELTAERFRDHPAAGRIYGSGDLVSARPDGVLDFHGRVDDQVKVRGFRIEPGEIEHVLRTHPQVANAAVVVQRPQPDDARLIAFIVPADGAAPDAPALRAHLESQLPPHMVPNAWPVVAELPLTATGKIDRRALAGRTVSAGDAPAAAPGPDPAPATAALSPIEQAVAELWSQALDLEVTRPDANFFALGGHSLLALGVVEELREDLGVPLTLTAFMTAPTVAGQAELVEAALLAAHEDAPGEASHDTARHTDARAGVLAGSDAPDALETDR
ncbi:amino acid adenylation domain-containing protein [Streptomyces celluloflavus]|uniref:Amino acid adenylation domain-containing protein n=1 Tax=Streptomyces celluloflavus TaxID=58344 RepID=A0ABW7RF99_9ACTN